MLQQLKGRKLLLVLAIPALPFVLFYGSLFARLALSAAHNEITLHNFARPFLEYPLPPRTVEVSNSAEWGVLSAGNHCGFTVRRILETQLSEDEIRAYYHDVGYPAIVPERSGSLGISHLDGLLSVGISYGEPREGFVTISLVDGIYSGTFWDAACR